MVIQSHYVIDSLRLDMKWEYAALELIEATVVDENRPDDWPKNWIKHDGNWWVLRTDRTYNVLKIRKFKNGTLRSWEGALYRNRDPFLLFMEVAKEGWEMTSSIPVSLRVHFNGGEPLGGYNMMPMMRRRLKE